MWMPSWAWKLFRAHLFHRQGLVALRWMNRLALLSITLGVFAWTSVISIMEGLQEDTRGSLLESKAHLLWEGTPEEKLSEKRESLEKLLGSHLKSLKFILQTEGLIEQVSARQRGRIRGAGVILQGMENFTENEIRMGAALEEELLLLPGDSFRLRSAWKLDAPPLDFQNYLTIRSGLREIDKVTVQLSQKKMENWLGLKSAISRVEIQLDDPFLAEDFKAPLSQLLGKTLKTWQENDASLWYSYRLEKFMMSLAVFFVVLLGMIALHLSLSLRVASKIREMALLRALGAESSLLGRIFLSEGLALGLAGGLLGLLGAWVFCRWTLTRFALPYFFENTQIPVSWSWPRNIFCLVLTLFFSLLASWKPAKRVALVEVQEGLRS